MSEAKAVSNLIDVSQTVKNNEHCPLNDRECIVFRGIVGSLMFLATKTQPDLSVAKSMLASNLRRPTKISMINA